MIGNRIRGWLTSINNSLHTLTGRITVVTALATAIGLLLLTLTYFFTVRNTLYHQTDRELIAVATDASASITADLEGLGGLNSTALEAANVGLVLLRSDGSSRGVPGAKVSVETGYQELAVARTQMNASARTIHGLDGTYYRQVAVPITISSGKWAIVLVRPQNTIQAVIAHMVSTTVALSITVLLASTLMAFLLARSVMRPIKRMSEAVSRVTETNELVPIGIHSDDEIGTLSRNFDTMIHSLASSRERQKRLIADAGHELRTPLTSMRTNVELLVADENSGMLPPGARQDILNDVSAQLAEFTALVGDLVQLSREDADAPRRELIDFADVVRTAIERAHRRGPNLIFDAKLEPLMIIGEPDTLGRAVTNLLDNAVKFSPPKGHIFIGLHGNKLTIEDEGPGIAEEDLPKIFDRFYRSNKARNTPGTGLGLSIVAHTVNAHGGQVWASNSPATLGARFTMVLPEASDEEIEAFES